jgi:prepilin-type N-terminal cleavage/methylation domain-containing protein
MFIERARRQRRLRTGFTLVELMVGIGVFSIAATAMLSLFVYSAKSFAALSNYSELSRLNREAVDTLSREIRQARGLTAFSTNSVTILDGTGAPVTYAFNASNKTLTRTRNGATKVLLRDCTVLTFNVCQRNPIAGSYDVYPVATTIDTAKVINLSWKSSRSSLNGRVTSENVQTARIVIRKQ